MIGLGQDDKPKLVGAKEKREMAKRIKNGNFDQIKSKREGKESSPAASVALVYVLSATVAWFVTQATEHKALGLHTGDYDVDHFLFGPGVPNIMGDPAIDLGLAVILRGLVIFLLAGILPGLSWIWIRMLDNARMNAYITFWGMPVGLALFYYALTELIIPMFSDFM